VEPVLVIQAIIMGIVEGLTEFLPISSTGHLILTGELLGFLDEEKRHVFEIFIQIGAMLAVIWEYREKFVRTLSGVTRPGPDRNLFTQVVVAFIPAAFIGYFCSDLINDYLFNPEAVATSFIVGGFIILWAEKRQHQIRIEETEQMTVMDALKVGLFQCLALIPGTSRSGATIIGGLLLGFSRKSATEFSFFLAVPTLSAASLYSLFKARDLLSLDDMGLFMVGLVASMLSAFVAIRALLKFIATHTFVVFAWYRIAFGFVVLAVSYLGVIEGFGG
jgi:undecaprenyl-diphosphatase